MKRRNVLFWLAASAAGAVSGQAAIALEASPQVHAFKNPTFGCCGAWVDPMKAAGFAVTVTELDDTSVARRKWGLPDRFGSCHATVAAGYVVDGHVPANDVRKLLATKPVASGLARPGMPVGSPGMELGSRKYPYQVVLVAKDGRERAFSTYP